MGKIGVVLVLLGLVAVIGTGMFHAGPEPQIRISPSFPAIGKRTVIKVEVSEPSRGLSHVRVDFVQGERTELLAEKGYAHRSALQFWGAITARDTISVPVGRETIQGLKTGNATIRITAGRTGGWLRSPDPVVEALVLPVRLSPPSLEVLSTKTYVAQGGCEVVVYRVGESSLRDGVRVGSEWFPGYPLPGGGSRERFALFAIPYDVGRPEVRLVAVDGAENEAQASFVDQFFPKRFKRDTIEVSDAFLSKVVPEIMGETPDLQDKGSDLENYLAINGELRRRQDQQLRALGQESRAEFLWKQPFLSIPNGKVMAGFADHRSYRYGGRLVDEQVHLGYDLAVTRRAPVPAANNGVVVMARYFGIYGNTVILDHGYGLMSLYSHLSSMAVGEGQEVSRGDIIGQTGETGLAGGDHLHFSMLLRGIPVTPVEWWDAHWLGDRIARKLGPALPWER